MPLDALNHSAKSMLRATMLEARAALPDDRRRQAALALAGHWSSIAALAGDGIVSGFVAFRDEIDPLPLMQALHARGTALALPRVDGARLAFHRWSPDDPLLRGRYGLMEPAADTPVAQPAVMLIPLAAFDRRGNRLGYGGGFYDRVLAARRPRLAIGIAYGFQEVPMVPVSAHDQPLDMVLTEHGLVDCRAAPGA